MKNSRRGGEPSSHLLLTQPLWTLLLLALLMVGNAWSREGKPNVIIIYTDDQGTVDAGCYGAEDLETPGIDRLAATGIRFTQFYAPAPVCSPSRAGMLTGKYPVNAGVPGNVSSRPGNPGMPAEQLTLAELLKGAGYATAHIGKWHLGYTPETMPNAQGFDHSFGHMGGCIDNYSHYFYWAGPNRHDLHRNGKEVFHDGSYFPDLMVKEAGEFMEAHQDEPFFIYFAMNAPHYPYQGEAAWLAKYRAAGVPSPRDLYAAFLSSLDARIGLLVDRLEALGLREDTIIIMQSDHGHSMEERAHFGGGSAGPYRGAKFSMFEGGLRVPAIISWPGHLEEGAVRDQLSHGSDWFPTIAALCNVSLPITPIDGMSLVPVLRDAKAPTPHKVLHWATKHGKGYQWAVREGDWKLIGNPRDPSAPKGTPLPKHMLVNLAKDPGERTNLVETDPDQFAALKALHEAWFSQLL
ncbi:MAG: sulfatase-like hydrolase/transferase [Candidatus Hydrogenedentes bacterium]|nr:sulfatase-like hydrolase/transferase [Candidatus Hydrogenedentota bacterium]